MKEGAAHILKTYVTLTLLSTFASSFIWGINTLFLLDAGLSITQAFAANAFFTLGQVIFEVPTGVLADTWGRRASYLLGAATLLASTLLYLWMWRSHGPFWGWGLSSVLLGLGFTFFSGATEAWLVDGLNATGYGGTLESAFAKGRLRGGRAAQHRPHLGGPRPAQPAGAVGDARRVVQLRRPDLRLLCDAAVPARAVRPEQLHDRRPRRVARGREPDRRRPRRALGAEGLPAPDLGAARRNPRERGRAPHDGRHLQLLGRPRRARGLGARLRGGVADPAGVRERAHPVRAARDGAVGGQHGRFAGRRGGTAGPRQGRAAVGLPHLVRRRRGRRAAGLAAPAPRPPRARVVRSDPRGPRGRSPGDDDPAVIAHLPFQAVRGGPAPYNASVAEIPNAVTDTTLAERLRRMRV